MTFQKISNSAVISVVMLYPTVPDADYIFCLQKYLATIFDYYEIVIAANPFPISPELEKTISSTPNINCIILNNKATDDILRQKAFEQAIGDYVVLFDPNEAEFNQIGMLVDSNANGYDFTGLAYDESFFSLYTLLSKIFFLGISKLSGYHLDDKVSYTGCYSRSLINSINENGLGKSYLRLLLATMGFKSTSLPGASRKQHNFIHVFKRLGGSLDIIGSVPHRLLLLTAWLSLAACLGNIFYIIYAIAIWLFAARVQPGWTTEALSQSILFGLLFFSIFVFSCILAAQIDQKREKCFSIARSVSRSDFISSFKELNVTDKQ